MVNVFPICGGAVVLCTGFSQQSANPHRNFIVLLYIFILFVLSITIAIPPITDQCTQTWPQLKGEGGC